ncbi:hypothetical protein BIV57_12830 [Mangrovactinospora gilvigrisea]|uniref:DUF2771 domain-containing protein n=1 Tax=Mangrovactinospora gilvigrisea TaxID=1428644 RepID=A0A1J7BEP8_9ACTN|nr:hypothetical protein [Mangrovactinospora gilvigrisea]OIV37045.1 hypothetical protein BIV57_12830 [Mangrovactinospora gilvigrisea]
MTIRRRATVLGAAALSLAALSACGMTKPTPVATVGSNTATAHSEAACYHGGDALPASELQSCASKDVQKLTVVDGNKVRFGVDTSIAKKGWFILVGQRQTGTTRLTYRTLDSASLFTDSQGQQSKTVDVKIVQSPDGQSIHGMWNFRLQLRDS